MTRLLSNIIKGHRIRSESALKIENTSKYNAQDKADENLATDVKEQEEKANRKIEQAESRANMILQKAEEEAIAKTTIIIKEGRDKIKMERAIALESAKEEGYNKGYEKGQLEAQNLVEEGKQIVETAKEERQKLLDELEPKIIEMIINIVNKLTSEEINHNKDTILVLIRKTLDQLSSDIFELSIKISPDDYDFVLDNKEVIAKNTVSSENIQIIKDATLNKGACIIETPFGSIKSDVDEAFGEIKKQMRLIYNKK